MTTTVRPATAADAPLLGGLNQQLIRDEGHRNPMNLAQLTERMRIWLGGEYQAVLFSQDTQTVGYALFRRETDHVYLRQFFVVAAWRRQGIGRAAMAWLRTNAWYGAPRIRLDVLTANPAGAAFWRAVGFADYCTSMEMPGPAAAGPVAEQAPAQIRPATAADVPGVNRIQQAWEIEDSAYGYVAESAAEMTLYVGQCFFVAEAGAIVGFVFGQVKESPGLAVIPAGQKYLEIESLCVLREHRSAGLGHRLVDAATRWAREREIAYMLVYSAVKDVDRVLHFYRTCGFESWFVQMFRAL